MVGITTYQVAASSSRSDRHGLTCNVAGRSLLIDGGGFQPALRCDGIASLSYPAKVCCVDLICSPYSHALLYRSTTRLRDDKLLP